MTTTEWELATWSNNLLDTRVKLTKGSNEIIGVLRSLDAGDHQIMVDGGGIVSLGRPGAWSVSTVKVPPVVLPSGVYRNSYNGFTYFIDSFGAIYCLENMKVDGAGGPYSQNDYDTAEFTRLRDEAELVSEVMGKLTDLYNTSIYSTFREDRNTVAAEYGVTL
jgi:hypothetical protein